MTALVAKERRDRRTSGRPPGGARTYGRVYLVETTSKTDGANTVLGAIGVPTRLEVYQTENEVDDEALVVDRQASQLRKTPFHWEVAVSYSTDIDVDKEEAAQDDDPLAAPPDIDFGFEVFRVVASSAFDVLGSQVAETRSSIENSAEQPFDPPPMKDDSRPILTVTRNEQFFNPQVAIDFQNAVNDDVFTGADAGEVKVQGISATEEISPGNPENKFWRVTYIFAYSRDGWKLQLLDHGTRIVDPNDPAKFVPYTEDGVVTDIPLDGAGNALTAGDPIFLEFDVYLPKTFAELGLNEILAEALGIPDVAPPPP